MNSTQNAPFWWNELVNAALLGTDRRAVPLAELPDDIRQPLANQSGVSPEKTLLRAAALSVNYGRAGAEPSALPLPALPPCPPETRHYAPETAVKLLRELLDEQIHGTQLLVLLLEKLREQNVIVPPDWLIPLLEKAETAKMTEVIEPIADLIGERGRWLAAQNPAWAIVLPADLDALWQHGTKDERNMVISYLRQTDPARAVQLLESVWEQESVQQQRSWMYEFMNGLGPADEPFLTRIWQNLHDLNTRKTTQQAIFQDAACYLLRLPGSALHQTIRERLRRYVTTRKSLLGRLTGQEAVTMTLPNQDDDFFNPATMTQYGLETNADLTGAGRIRHWFFQCLAAMPPATWQELWQVDEENLVDFCFRQSFGKEDPKATTDALELVAMLRHKSTTLARSLLRTKHTFDFRSELVRQLPPAEQEHYIEANALDFSEYPANYSFLTDTNRPRWSVSFSQYVVVLFAKRLLGSYQFSAAAKAFLADAATGLHRDGLLVLDTDHYTNLTDYQQDSIRKHLRQPMERWLTLRDKIQVIPPPSPS